MTFVARTFKHKLYFNPYISVNVNSMPTTYKQDKKVFQKQINKWHKYVSVETFNSTHNKEKKSIKNIIKISFLTHEPSRLIFVAEGGLTHSSY